MLVRSSSLVIETQYPRQYGMHRQHAEHEIMDRIAKEKLLLTSCTRLASQWRMPINHVRQTLTTLQLRKQITVTKDQDGGALLIEAYRP